MSHSESPLSQAPTSPTYTSQVPISPAPGLPSPGPAAMGPRVTRTTTVPTTESIAEAPPSARPPPLESLHLLLFDIRLTSLSARLANDRTLQAFLNRLPPLTLTDLFSEVQMAREQDIAASPRSLLPTEEAANAAFRSARRALKLEFRLSELLTDYRRGISAEGLAANGDDPSTGSSLPHSVLVSLGTIIQTSDAHRRSHTTALRRALQSWAQSEDSVHLRANIESLQARLAVLTSDMAAIASPGSSPSSPTSQHGMQSQSADLGTNPFDSRGYETGSRPLLRSFSSSTLGATGQAARGPAARDSQAARSTASLSAAGRYDAAHPYGAPWPPSPHYYFLPPYGHPHGSFPPLYDSTPLHFPLTDRLLRDTPSRAAGFHPGSSSASNPSFRPHVAPNPAFEVGDIDEAPGPNAMAIRPVSTRPSKPVSGKRSSNALVANDRRLAGHDQMEVAPVTNGRLASRRKIVGKGGKKVASRLAYLAQSEGAGMIASAVFENAPVPKNLRRWHSIGRVVNDWYGFDDHGPSKAELFTKGMGLMLNQTKRRHSFHAGTRSAGISDDDDSDDGGGLAQFASHAVGMMAGRGKRKSMGYAFGNFATDALQTFAQTKKGSRHKRRNSWSNGLRGRDDRYDDRRGGRFDGDMLGRGGGNVRHDYVDERRGPSRGGRGRRRNAYSDDEDEDGLPGLVSHAMQAMMSGKKRSGRGRSGGMVSQIGDLVGRGKGDRRSRKGEGPAEAIETALKVLSKFR